MQPIILIQWNTLTTGWDSYVDTFTSNEQMTYLDLLTTLENLPEEELLKPVTLYDEDVNDYLKVRRVEQKEFDTYLII
jgi:hypothetical protein|tara:strand:- start:318 stop:551 length:234 start_codon:yes stop_codon:yes gene_type:complete